MFRLRVIASATCLAFIAPASGAPLAPAGLIVTGILTEGDAPSRFSQAIDLRTGFSKRTQQMGDSQTQLGFDGAPWEESNGIVMVSNLPSAVAQRRARGWLDQQAWRERMRPGEAKSRTVVAPGGVKVSLAFDPATGLLSRTTLAGDWGPVVFSYGDWRKVGGFTYPFRREEVSSVGERSIVQAVSARFVSALPPGSLARPIWRSHAERLLGGSATVPFEAVGAKGTHMMVAATVNGRPAKLIFDTGAANYIVSEAAPGLDIKPVGGVNLSGVGEASSTGGYATIDRIALGPAVLRNETIVVGPSPFPPNAGANSAIGFTGFEFLAEYVTTIDYPARTLRFAETLPSSPHALRVPFYNDGSHIYVRARLNGVDGFYGVDTGDGGTVTVFPEFAARMKIKGASGKIAQGGGGVGGGVKAQPGMAGRFTLGGLNFDQLPIRFSRQTTGAFASKSLAGNLGGALLQCFRITIDFPHHLLLMDPAPESCAPGGKVSRAGGRRR